MTPTTSERLALCALLSISLTACGLNVPEAMSREAVIAAVKQCEEAGLKPTLMQNWYGEIADVQCRTFDLPPAKESVQ